jgi:serine/threonine-protein kinase
VDRRLLTTALADRYRIERELGAGGMATVYLAEDVKHHRRVALKVLRPELAHALGAERFLREIETTAALHHPHILPLYDSGAAGELLFYVMPYVEGESLRDRLAREKQLPIDDALTIAGEISDALSYAHSRGVIHRDIKPENIMLEGGHAMVADFGIARAVSAAGTESITQTGTAVGTPSYMSPEQAAGSSDLDGRSDLYSLGCVVYEMLAGQAPFSGPTVESVVRQHLVAEPRPITQIRPAVPPAIAGVLQRALAKNPADRFSPVAQFADALRTGTLTPPSPRPARKRWTLVAGASVVALAVATSAEFLSKRGSASAATTSPSIAVLPFADLSGGTNEYLGDGMAETLINALSSVEGLSVAARTSAFSFKGQNRDVRAIGEALGVGAVLEGSVQRAGERLRITAQLINARDGFHLWSESFDRNATDLFAVQDEVARAVVSALQIKLVQGTSARVVEHGTSSLEAYNAYLQGIFFWNKRSAADLVRAEKYFKDAIAADSGFAKAWAGLAATYVLFTPSEYDVNRYSATRALDLAERSARRALAMNGKSAEGYAALGNALDQRGRLEEADEAFRRSIDIDPRYPTAHQWYATTLVKTGRYAEALASVLTAQRLDPLSLIIGAEVGEHLDLMGRRAEATAQYEQMLERYPSVYALNFFAGVHFLVDRDFDRAAKLLGGLAINLGGDSTVARRVESGLREAATRNATLRALADGDFPGAPTLSPPPEVSLGAHRVLGGDDAAIDAFEHLIDRGETYERIYISFSLSVLGPEMTAHPRTQAAIQRFLGRLRARQ